MIAEATIISAGYQQTEVGVIPNDWRVELLDEVAIRGSGHTPNKQKSEYWNGDVRWISLKDTNKLDQRYIFETAATITLAGIANSSAVMHMPGTIVLSRDAGVGKSAIMASAMAVSQHFIAWRCGPDLHNEFLYYWLQVNKREFERIAMGSTIKTIGLPYFRELKVTVPPLAEQEAIAEALGDADAWIESLEQLVAKKRHLKQATMQQLLTGKKRLPGFTGEWRKKSIEELAELKNGYAFKSSTYTETGSFKVVTIANVQDGRMELAECNAVAELPRDLQPHHRLKIGGLLISMTGNVGRVCRVSHRDCVLNQRVGLLHPTGTSAEYLFHLLSLSAFLTAMIGKAKGGAQGNLSKGDILEFELSVPVDSAEQCAIADVLSDMDAEIEAIEAKLAKARQIKQGMMQELLTGRIRLI